MNNSKRLQDDLDSQVIWANECSFEFNLSECYVLYFRKKTRNFLSLYSMQILNEGSYPKSNVERYLRILFSNNFSW